MNVKTNDKHKKLKQTINQTKMPTKLRRRIEPCGSMVLRLRKLWRMLLRRSSRWTWRCRDLDHQQTAIRHIRNRAAMRALMTLIATTSACQESGSILTW